ncbi:MAG TPA: YbaB/EbfC family nucleoid-associated protein [Firmicutes bacterium]|nr:YbaB/EbfC family nucleoid-associated protein [Bacillota bacterium]HHY99446.1 YbaB/EbfC family nucleoid-associated protein [Bacillota bacterium]
MNGMGNMNKLMKQVQKMQADIARVQEQLKDMTCEATAGGGVVSVTANGHQEIIKIRISPEALDPEDVTMLEDLVLAAVNEALRKSQELAASELGKVAGGVNLPGMPGLIR